MGYGNLIHEMILEHLRRHLLRDYKEIKINRTGVTLGRYPFHFAIAFKDVSVCLSFTSWGWHFLSGVLVPLLLPLLELLSALLLPYLPHLLLTLPIKGGDE